MEEFLYPKHPAGNILTSPICCGTSVFLTKLILHFINEYDQIYIFSSSLYPEILRKLINCFSNYISIHIIPNILNDED